MPLSVGTLWKLRDLGDFPCIVNSEEYAAKAVEKFISGSGCTTEVKFALRSGIDAWKEMPCIGILQDPRVDISVTIPSDNDAIALVVEVKSKGSKNTSKSVAYESASQLSCLRKKSDINTVVGFAFPGLDEEAPIVKVTVKVANLGFWCYRKVLKVEDAEKEIGNPLG